MHKRHVIIHYHFFKNAGTSLDHILKKAFPQAWMQMEADEQGPVTAERMLGEFANKPELKVISSHTARLSLPRTDDVQIYPVVFIRHPLDRVLSVYQFERKQTQDTEGSIQARKLDLPEFVTWRLDRPRDTSFRNFQCHRLAGLANGSAEQDIFQRGLKGLQSLPYVGMVEAFDPSIALLQNWLQTGFPGLRLETAKLNVTQSEDSSLSGRLAHLKTCLGNELYAQLVKENEADLGLYRHVAQMYDRLLEREATGRYAIANPPNPA
ncbi:MAG: sulfotransferase family 2 domain-containing protein [Methylococcaceae bacterium]